MSRKWPEIPSNRRVFLAVGILFAILWLAERAFGVYPLLLTNPERPRLSGADSYYHLRHAEAVLNDYPVLLRMDDMSSFPWRERGLNQGFYDILVATISKVSFGLISPRQILTWLAAGLTGFTALLLAYWLARKESPWCAMIFLLMMLAYPGPLTQVANVGNGDHHGWEIFLQTFLMLSLTWTLRSKVPVKYIIAPAFILNLFFLSWAGAPLHLFFTGICFFVWAFVDHPPETRARLIWKGVVMGLLLAGFPTFIDMVINPLMIWDEARKAFVVGGIALAAGYPLLVWAAQKLPGKVRPFIAPIALVSSLALLKLSPDLWNAFLHFISPRSAGIAEHARVTPTSLFQWYGLTPLALLVGPILIARDKKLREYCLPIVYGVGLAFFWIYTRDFNYYAPYAIAATTAYCLYRLPWRTWTPAMIVLIASTSVLPLPNQVRPWITRELANELVINNEATDQAAHFLAQIKDKTKKRRYGLLAPWDLGNILAYTSKTGVLASQTHSPYLASLFYNESMKELYGQMKYHKLRFFLIPTRNMEEKLGTDYVLTGEQPSVLMEKGPDVDWEGQTIHLPKYNKKFRRLAIVRLFDGMAKDMGRFRMVYESPQRVVRTIKLSENLKSFAFVSIDVTQEEAEALKPILRSKNKVHPTSRGLLINPRVSPDIRIFERVRGAVLTGQTDIPHGPVGAYLSISSPYAEGPYIITWRLLADNFGYFDFRLPYPTDRPLYEIEGSIRVNGEYRVECNGKVYKVSLTEKQIQSGAKIPLDSFPVIKDTNKEE
jgi:asparagine N-glycosylation enzyme membrane subunit Stt3